jgi:hypothetical protein
MSNFIDIKKYKNKEKTNNIKGFRQYLPLIKE